MEIKDLQVKNRVCTALYTDIFYETPIIPSDDNHFTFINRIRRNMNDAIETNSDS